MREDGFRVTPVASYRGARYPGVVDPEPEAEGEDAHSPLAVLCAFVLVAGLAFGLVGCYMRTDYTPDDPRPPTPDCLPDELRCASALVVETCEDGRWVGADCDVLCAERHGGWGYSLGCDATAADPCRCEYDVILGAAPACTPGDLFCEDDRTLVRCTEGYVEERQSCDEVCHEEHGNGWVSAGCDATSPADPCRCFYDVLDGEMPACTPEDLFCEDERTVWLCEGSDLTRRDCTELCEERFGAGTESEGCDASVPDDPCRCLLPDS